MSSNYKESQNLAQRLAGDFSKAVRKRGIAYFRLGRVEIERGSSTGVEAVVFGSQDYAVSLEWKGQTIIGTCECAFFDDGGACKHLWATILAADKEGYLSKAAGAPNLDFKCGDYDSGEAQGVKPGRESQWTQPPLLAAPPPKPKPPAWRAQLDGFSEQQGVGPPTRLNWPASRRILYIVESERSVAAQEVVISLSTRDAKPDGSWKTLAYNPLRREQILQLPSPEDREILSSLVGAVPTYGWGYGGWSDRLADAFHLPDALAEKIISIAARAGRCYLRNNAASEDLSQLAWDEGQPWHSGMEMSRRPKGGWEVSGILRRGEDKLKLKDVVLATPGGLMFTDHFAARLAPDTRIESLIHFKHLGPIHAPEHDLDDFLAALLSRPNLPPIDLPAEIHLEEVQLQARPCLKIQGPDKREGPSGRLRADLYFDYEGRQIPGHDPSRGIYEAQGRRFLPRDTDLEAAAARLLTELGVKYHKSTYWASEPRWSVAPGRLPRVVRALVEAGWHIEAEGKIFRRPSTFKIDVSSGIDWFELHGNVEYGESKARLPELLEAMRRGETVVRLDDGTYGLLPEQWLKRIGLLAGLGTPENGHLRFRPSQAGVLDALLASQPEASCDETFNRVREELGRFQGVQAAAQPEGFVGHLRDYQREGVGWMQFLRRFSFGGCLADDMGVGKTAQVLAMLETRRVQRNAGETVAPSLVVVPRSLIFNWKQEAERFTPMLRVLDYTGAGRESKALSDYDVVLTTYGTLRRDVVRLKDIEFDYVVLDESQAIKNATTDAAKAVRLLRGSQRLALSGTPVENHLGELWSLFEFLNPGMLGRASVFKLTSGAGRNPEEETRRLLAHALRPFILRRTKAQVAPELPAKTEQTVYCEMESAQRRLYDELRQHYRDVLLTRIQDEGLAKSKIQVLEALLRLRQAACHPGLIDKQRSGEGSAKLDRLLEQLRDVLDEGHKALVFSQFTSLLAIVRERLKAEEMVFEYLDGATVDRQARVERFQNDADCQLFLISLKAGGLGLNLTAAEYVFLLDPWWNPAVEAQAIDRAHRIGQTQQVFAYRLISRDTVEEKVLELQKTKRDLATAIISEDNNLIRDLRREDLELLLS